MKSLKFILKGFGRATPFLGVMVLFFQCSGCYLFGFCGDDNCGWGEDGLNCPQDCSPPPVFGPTPEPGVEEPGVIEAIPNICGDGICNTMYENSDLCPDDCECVDDGECEPGEGLGCRDCTDDVSRYCGQSCESTEDCRGVLSCFEGVCWEPCACTGRCEEVPGESGGCEPCGAPCQEYCNSPDTFCDDGCCRCP